MRDDFNAATRRILGNRVGQRCSRCEASTIGPHADPARAVNIGVAAHITAASPAGPRYDGRISERDRVSPDNGIWLCPSCATIVDRDERRYTVETLQAMKRAAEEAALLRIGLPVWRLDVSNEVLAESMLRHAPAGRSQGLQLTWRHVDALLSKLRALRRLLVELETDLDESDVDSDARRRIGVVRQELAEIWDGMAGRYEPVLRDLSSPAEYATWRARVQTSTSFDPVDPHWDLPSEVTEARSQVERWQAQVAVIRTAERGLQDMLSRSYNRAADAREVAASLIMGAGVTLVPRPEFAWSPGKDASPDFFIPALNAYLDVFTRPATVPFVVLRNELRARIRSYTFARARSSGRMSPLRRETEGPDARIRFYFIVCSAGPPAPVFEVKFQEARSSRRVREVRAFFVSAVRG